MRAFPFLPFELLGPTRTRVRGRPDRFHPLRSGPALVVLLLILAPGPVAAQYPAELAGRVRDLTNGEPLEGVLVEVWGAGRSASTDANGLFSIRGLEPGRYTVRMSRLGYMSREVEVELRNGERTRLDLSLAPDPIPQHELRADAERRIEAADGVIRISRRDLERSGDRSVADALESRAGLVVRGSGPTGARTLSIRGSGADDVLILLDGTPLNSALTGEADLAALSTSRIESITVLKGARSARYGPGAQAGVVLIETRHTVPPFGLRLGTGSLGTQSVEGQLGAHGLGLEWSAGGRFRDVGGRFRFRSPEQLGGGTATRQNADLREWEGFVSGMGRLAGGTLRLRGGITDLERGLPGRSFLPSPEAREHLTRGHGSLAWERSWGAGRLSTRFHGLEQEALFSDPAPPVALPFDSRTRARTLGLRIDGAIDPGGPDPLESLDVGLEVRDQRYESTEFDDSAPDGRLDIGLFAAGEFSFAAGPLDPRLVAALRMDRDDIDDRWRLSHELAARATLGPMGLHVRHASSYSPPTFGDQFFRTGVAVQPNPDLRAERVPSELDVGAEVEIRTATLHWSLGLEAFFADIDGMIIWSPDFRFVWSPRNFDVKRRGLDLQVGLTTANRRLELRGRYSLARVTYDRPGDADTIQVVYRPRHTGGLDLQWRPGAWELTARTDYMGTRYPVPARVNALDPFWTIDLRVRRSFRLGNWRLEPALSVDRLLDNQDTLIFGFPEPGRTIRLELAVRPE